MDFVLEGVVSVCQRVSVVCLLEFIQFVCVYVCDILSVSVVFLPVCVCVCVCELSVLCQSV